MANANSPIPATNYSSDKQSNSTTANTSAAVVGDYLVRSKIGQGSFATVFKAVHKVNSPTSTGNMCQVTHDCHHLGARALTYLFGGGVHHRQRIDLSQSNPS
jgi:hypothetical protein